MFFGKSCFMWGLNAQKCHTDIENIFFKKNKVSAFERRVWNVCTTSTHENKPFWKKIRKTMIFPYLAWFLKISAIGSRSDESHILLKKWFSFLNLFRKCSEPVKGSKENISKLEFHFVIFEFLCCKIDLWVLFLVWISWGSQNWSSNHDRHLSLNDFMYTENFQVENLASQIYTVTISSPLFCLLLLSTLPSQLIERFVELIRIKVLHGFVSSLATLFTLLCEIVLSLDISSWNLFPDRLFLLLSYSFIIWIVHSYKIFSEILAISFCITRRLSVKFEKHLVMIHWKLYWNLDIFHDTFLSLFIEF